MLIKAAFSVPSKVKEDKTEQNCSNGRSCGSQSSTHCYSEVPQKTYHDVGINLDKMNGSYLTVNLTYLLALGCFLL